MTVQELQVAMASARRIAASLNNPDDRRAVEDYAADLARALNR